MEENKKIENVSSVTVAGTVLADLFGLTERRIRQLAEEGIITKVTRGRYDLSTSVRNYIVHLKTNNDLKDNKTDGKLDIENEEVLLVKARREKVELEVAAMKGQMHYSYDVERVMNDMLANFRAKILALPTKAAPLLILKEEIGEIQGILRNEMLEALKELSSYNPEDFYSDKYIEIIDGDENLVVGEEGVKEQNTH